MNIFWNIRCHSKGNPFSVSSADVFWKRRTRWENVCQHLEISRKKKLCSSDKNYFDGIQLTIVTHLFFAGVSYWSPMSCTSRLNMKFNLHTSLESALEIIEQETFMGKTNFRRFVKSNHSFAQSIVDSVEGLIIPNAEQTSAMFEHQTHLQWLKICTICLFTFTRNYREQIVAEWNVCGVCFRAFNLFNTFRYSFLWDLLIAFFCCCHKSESFKC